MLALTALCSFLPLPASSQAREEVVDYGGDYMGEWSSGASEEESEGEGAAAAKKEKKVGARLHWISYCALERAAN